ncbi:MAG: glycosyltransferase [candidate division Zixibacteria bacterium]|nr:glycosyltransferase [candidate division Zixibacteria bacterium]
MEKIFVFIYFALLFYIAFYGLHLYYLISIYLKNSREAIPSTAALSRYPMVTVQLPIYNERAVAARLIKTIAAFDWPQDKLEIQVLDDSDDDTISIVTKETARLAQLGFNIKHIRRGNRRGYKAGALAFGMNQAKGDYIAIFDADNIPHPDFLKRLMPFFDDPRMGMVQARWSFLNREQSLLCRAQALFLDAHFFVEQASRSRGGLFMNFNGTAGLWHRQAIEDAGGWQADTLTEDLDLSYRAQLAGWKMILAEEVDVPTELPATIRSFKTQQYRWARGAVETAIKVLPKVLRSPLPLKVKICSCFHLTQKSTSLALILLSIFLIPALYIRVEGGMLKLLLIDLPIFLAGTGSMSLFYGLAFRRQRELHSLKNKLVLPLITSIGIGLSVNNSLAVISAIFCGKGTFIRTPKSGSTTNDIVRIPTEYRIRSDKTVTIEVILAIYSALAVGSAVFLNLYWSIPFLMTFAFGYFYFSWQSLREQYA